MIVASEWILVGLLLVQAVIFSAICLYPLRSKPTLCMVSFPMVLLLILVAYYHWGGYTSLKQYIHKQKTLESVKTVLKTIKDPQELIDRLKSKLDNTPKSAQGWFLLGRLFNGQNDTKNAYEAFAKAYQFNPNKETYAVEVAFSSWRLNNQHITPDIQKILNKLLQDNPNQADVLSMLAMDSFFQKKYSQAILYWQKLLDLVPPESKEAGALRQAIAKANENLNLNLK
ncbi:MAG: hypothetical protein H0U75_05690 [Legionella sp.]|nr:hypothetical protein [Legionella sp.]